MIQRLLRGRAFYLVFGALVIFLYVRTVSFRSAEPLEMPSMNETTSAPEWWTESLGTQELTQAAQRAGPLGAAALLLAALFLGLAAGGVVIALRGFATGRFRSVWRFPSTAQPPWSFRELGRILFLILAVALLIPFVRFALLAAQPTWSLDAHLWITVSMLILDTMAVLIILAFAEGKGRPAWRVFGCSRHAAWCSIKTGLLGYVTIFPWLLVLFFLVVEAARRLGYQPPLEPIHRLLFEEHRAPVLALTALLACAIGPVAEEFFFRGVVYATIRRRVSRVLAMAISGALFALIHTNVVGFLPILLLGGLLAYLYERTGSLIAPIAVHVLHNTLLLSLAMVFRQLVPFG